MPRMRPSAPVGSHDRPRGWTRRVSTTMRSLRAARSVGACRTSASTPANATLRKAPFRAVATGALQQSRARRHRLGACFGDSCRSTSCDRVGDGALVRMGLDRRRACSRSPADCSAGERGGRTVPCWWIRSSLLVGINPPTLPGLGRGARCRARRFVGMRTITERRSQGCGRAAIAWFGTWVRARSGRRPCDLAASVGSAAGRAVLTIAWRDIRPWLGQAHGTYRRWAGGRRRVGSSTYVLLPGGRCHRGRGGRWSRR